MDIGAIWDLIALGPMINVLVVLSHYLLNSFGLTIILLTIVIRAGMYPLTRKQLQSTKKLQELQPKMREVQKKYAKDRQRRAKEEMAVMKEAGANPAGCLLPMLIQFPVWIALYQSIIRVLAIAPEDFLNLSRHLYSAWPMVFSQVPLENQFFWLNLALPDPMYIMAILVGGTMWLQQKMTTPVSADPKQQAQMRMMTWMMPLMFGFFTLTFPAGLALYWLTSNIISIVMQYFVSGWGGLATLFTMKETSRDKKPPQRTLKAEKTITEESATDADIIVGNESQEEGTDDGTSGDKRQDSGGGYPDSLKSIRRQARRSKRHRPK